LPVDELAVAIDPHAMVATVTDECTKEDDIAATAKAGTPTWQLDPAHSSVEFSVKHNGHSTSRRDRSLSAKR
jgi:polyisoprenoid-binding protein YceI